MSLDPAILDRLFRYCSYRERATSEVISKLDSLGVKDFQRDDYIKELIETGYLKEERYVTSFIQGKLRMKGWGKNKIKAHLLMKKVKADLINDALEQLNHEDYMMKLKEIANHKLAKVKGVNDYEKKSKVFRYLQQKGYETSLIHQVLFQEK